jgi:hypothetical protein
MMKSILKLSLLGLLAVAVSGMPVALHAQDTNAPATTAPATNSPPAAPKKSRALPFHGKVEAIDTTAKTISVGKLTIQITSQTRIMKNGNPATLEDGTVGDIVSGNYKKDAEGKLNALIVRFGVKPKASAPPAASTNSAPAASTAPMQ